MKKYGFKTIGCAGMDFDYIRLYLHTKPILDVTLRRVLRRIEWIPLYIRDIGKKKSMHSVLFNKYIRLNNKMHLYFYRKK